jgi:hypothetical protein
MAGRMLAEVVAEVRYPQMKSCGLGLFGSIV